MSGRPTSIRMPHDFPESSAVPDCLLCGQFLLLHNNTINYYDQIAIESDSKYNSWQRNM